MNWLYRLHDPSLPFIRLDFRRELTHALVTLMEMMWIAPWFAVVLSGAAESSPLFVLAFVALNGLAALFIVRWFDAWGMWENLRQIVFLAGLLIAFFATIGIVWPPDVPEEVVQVISENVEPVTQFRLPAFLPVLVLLGIVWWRGLRLAMVSPTPTRVAFGVRLGILFFFGAAVFPHAQAATLAALPPFFFFGLLATAMARANSLRELWGQPVVFGPRWGGFMTLAAGLITLLGFLVAAALAGIDPETIAQVIQPIISAVVLGIAVIMTPLLLLIQAVVEGVINALDVDLPMGNLIQTPNLEQLTDPANQPEAVSEIAAFFARLGAFIERVGGMQICISVFVIMTIVLVIVFTLRRRERAAMLPGEEREDIEGDALGSLRDAFRRGLDALGGALNAIGQFGVGRDLFAALTVRRVYAQMVALAAKQGYPRAASETPYEYRQTLAPVFPERRDEVGVITEAYIRVHYGEVPADEAALQNVVQALDRLKAEGRDQRPETGS